MQKRIILTPEQNDAIKKITSFIKREEERVFILKGYAGTGKTTLVKEIITLLRKEKRSFNLIASTGRAAKVLNDVVEGLDEYSEYYASPLATTIHSLIYKFERITQDLDLFSATLSDNTGKLNEIKLKFTLRELPEHDGAPIVYIVDEASMISDNRDATFSFAEYGNEGRLLQDLLNYDPKGQFIFIGDDCQLPPVGQGISPALSVKYISKTFNIQPGEKELTEVVRQTAQNDITAAASIIRSKIFDQNSLAQGLRFPFRGRNNIRIIDGEDNLVHRYIEDIRKRDYSKATMIVLSNNKISRVSRTIRRAIGFDSDFLSPGDLLLVTQNNLISGLMNGDLITVLSIGRKEYRASLSFINVQVQSLATGYVFSQLLIEEILYSGVTNITQEQQTNLMIDFHIRAKKKGLKQGSQAYTDMMRSDSYLNALRCNYGYALTCHKAQGGEWDNVYLQLPRAMYYWNHKYAYQWVYTAMTRAKQQLYVLNDFWITA